MPHMKIARHLFKVNLTKINRINLMNNMLNKNNQQNKYSTISSKKSYAVANSDLRLRNFVLGEKVDEMASERPNDICYKFCLNQMALTYVEIKQRVDELAQSLLDLGFSKGDRLALLLPNVPELNLAILAAAKLGVIVVLLNPAYQLVEIEYMLKKTGAKGVIILV
jgi:fatty-acyl-CoA synthase